MGSEPIILRDCNHQNNMVDELLIYLLYAGDYNDPRTGTLYFHQPLNVYTRSPISFWHIANNSQNWWLSVSVSICMFCLIGIMIFMPNQWKNTWVNIMNQPMVLPFISWIPGFPKMPHARSDQPINIDPTWNTSLFEVTGRLPDGKSIVEKVPGAAMEEHLGTSNGRGALRTEIWSFCWSI